MPGSGLGLSIVRDVITNANGTVSAGPRQGGGATIGFTLPVSPAWPGNGSGSGTDDGVVETPDVSGTVDG